MRAAAFAVIRGERRDAFLLVQHCYTSPRLWGFPGGMVEAGEDVRAAARRETREETGLAVEIDQLLYSFERGDLTLHFFGAGLLGGAMVLQESEISDARWLCRQEVAALGTCLHPRVLTVVDTAAEHGDGPSGRGPRVR